MAKLVYTILELSHVKKRAKEAIKNTAEFPSVLFENDFNTTVYIYCTMSFWEEKTTTSYLILAFVVHHICLRVFFYLTLDCSK